MGRLTSEMEVAAALRIAQSRQIFASILRKGDVDAGAIFVEIQLDAQHSRLLARQLNFDGEYEWVVLSGESPVASWQVSERLEKEIKIDPDCWVVLVEDAQGRNIFDAEFLI